MSAAAVQSYFQSFLGVRSVLDAVIDGVQAGRVVLGGRSCAVVHDEGWYFLDGDPEECTTSIVTGALQRPAAERLYCVPVSQAWARYLAGLPLMRAPRYYFERDRNVVLPLDPLKDDSFVLRQFDKQSLEPIRAFRNVRSAIAAWGGEQLFLEKSLGCGIFERATGRLASAAFGYSMARSRLELSVATDEAFRGRGFAGVVCRTLIGACESRGISADWNCFMDNAGSVALARTLGYKPNIEFEMYIRAKPSY